MNISNTKREAPQAAAFRCGYCGYSSELPIEALGKKAKCPECGEVTRVMTAIGAMSAPADEKAPRAALFVCDQCDYATELPIETVGKKAKCPECGELTRVRSAQPTIMTELETVKRAAPSKQEEDVDSLATSYLGRATRQERTRQRSIPLAPEARQHCPHCHQLMPAKPDAAKPAPPAQAKPAAAPTQPEPRHSPISGSRSASESPARPAADPVMRCPFCREVILLAARKCKHCGEYLDDSLRCLSEPKNNKDRREKNSSRSAPESTGFNGLQELWYRIGPVKLLIAVGVLAVLGYFVVQSLGRKNIAAPGTPGSPGAVVEAGSGGGDDKSSAAGKGTLDKLTHNLEKQLKDTSIRTSGGSTLTFETSDKGLMPWDCELSGAGKSLKGRVTVPFKLESSEPALASGRGRYILEFASKAGGAWELQSVTKETRVTIKGGVETQIPDEDRPTIKQQNTDFAVLHFKKTLAKLTAAADD